jgi:hypothetical protein
LKNKEIKMDPFVLKTISNIIIFIGTGLTLLGGLGTWYFGNKSDELKPYYESINTASAKVEIIVESNDKINSHFMDRGGGVVFAKIDNTPLLNLTVSDSRGNKISDGRVKYSMHVNMPLDDIAVGMEINKIFDTKYIQILFLALPMNKKIISGKLICTFNNKVRYEFNIPEQKSMHISKAKGNFVDGELIFIRDLEKYFVDIKSKMRVKSKK